MFNKLVSSLLATRNFPNLDLIIGNQIAHKILDDIALPLLQKHLLHEFEDAQVVYHVLDVFFASQLISCLLELLVVEPLLAVVGPGAQHALFAAQAAAEELDESVAKVAESENSSIIDAFNHLIVIVARFTILIRR